MAMFLAHQWQEVVNSTSYYLLLKKGSLNREPFFLCNIVLSLLNYNVDCSKKSEGNQPTRQLIMKNIILYMIFISLIAPVRAEGLQLFGSRKSSEKDRANKSEELRNNDEMTEDY